MPGAMPATASTSATARTARYRAPANALTRAAALATAGQILTWNGAPAEVFYSASCGGRSESPGQVWPGADYPYMRSLPDDVHDEDVPWTFELTMPEAERILTGFGFEGRLRDVKVDDRNASGRASRLRLSGMQPGVIAGDQFRMAVGAARLRSTAFSIDQRGIDPSLYRPWLRARRRHVRDWCRPAGATG